MLPDERSEHEPEEPDLGPDIPNVEPEESEPTLGPEIPDVSPPDEGFFGPGDVPKDLLSAFWKLVVLFNVGLLATSLGAMFVLFEGRLGLGGGLLAVGLLALARGLYSYWTLDLEEGTDSD
ncbi:DUF7322 domain-containing protein [Halalkalicoccus jeotgali]|uniref:DUF7322 domain-containing protein n=1 Tax=Halalkalicoccus jeotgali (strain DSM 18796 / CECT 7217 / JCM 14584 / KCTC 4019 / B3) TaxID=795797 RepID=D8J6A0_HALJB|nr:hypothetical protein [Halalkalicoccus jeotgali]ADJ15818.1 hypothetical protein HacjB3_12175 [Halalkalicoccus jeotgali B3]ELY38283.1 hypothetical protein C497_07344 [Halalkalicoccus jeotgali B3]